MADNLYLPAILPAIKLIQFLQLEGKRFAERFKVIKRLKIIPSITLIGPFKGPGNFET